jgi:hypothetical protein
MHAYVCALTERCSIIQRRGAGDDRMCPPIQLDRMRSIINRMCSLTGKMVNAAALAATFAAELHSGAETDIRSLLLLE